jgi:Zn-dependent oligopeptidases
LRQINKELSTLEIDFSNHVLNETNAYQLVISDKKDLSGLPEWFIQSAANDAKAQGKDGKWIFTLQSSSRLPFLQYADNRNLREQIYNAYINRANKGDKNDNKAIISKVITLRLEKAQLLGFDTYANFCAG